MGVATDFGGFITMLTPNFLIHKRGSVNVVGLGSTSHQTIEACRSASKGDTCPASTIRDQVQGVQTWLSNLNYIHHVYIASPRSNRLSASPSPMVQAIRPMLPAWSCPSGFQTVGKFFPQMLRYTEALIGYDKRS